MPPCLLAEQLAESWNHRTVRAGGDLQYTWCNHPATTGVTPRCHPPMSPRAAQQERAGPARGRRGAAERDRGRGRAAPGGRCGAGQGRAEPGRGRAEQRAAAGPGRAPRGGGQEGNGAGQPGDPPRPRARRPGKMWRRWEAGWDEKRELQELNSRLRLFVGRVRELEEENRFLARELAELRQQELVGLRVPEQELGWLRVQLEELSRAKLEAELERDGLRRELAELRLLGAEVLEARRRLEPELARQWELLQRLRGDCVALEELLLQLQVEHGQLAERQQREAVEMRELRLDLAALPPPLSVLSLEELEATYEMVLGQSCRETLLRYQEQIRALQEQEAQRSRENLELLREEGRQCRQQLEELRRQGQELVGLQERLEEELLAGQERHNAEVEEYEVAWWDPAASLLPRGLLLLSRSLFARGPGPRWDVSPGAP